ncbi:Ig-like domain repeat protein [Treponema bryantii]|uniref:Ig-like domain repeat protein n=1 Tax=Treponema bryantii TaxID=163 RepID=UPI002B2FDDB1|nr:hypothetical protein TRBR_26670 [Treponema bryantii]
MKKFTIALLFLVSVFAISCEIGLGAAVDTDPPTLDISTPPVDAVIRDKFAIAGNWTDDGTIASVKVKLERTDGLANSKSHTFDADFKELKVGKGTWKYVIDPVAEEVIDGSYQATITIADSTNRKTIVTRTFTIDNTPPIIVLTRPSTAKDLASPDKYGQKFTLEGQAADTNNISRIELKLFTDKECTQPVNDEPVVLKNVPLSISMDAADYDSEDENYIYNKGETEEFSINVPKDGTGKQLYCKIYAYDGAARYADEDETATEDDEKGNCAEYFYLYKNIYTPFLQYYKITELYSILNGTYSETASRAVSPSTVKTDYLLSDDYQQKVSAFILNPKNNPTYIVTGRSPLALDGSDFTGVANDITTGQSVIVEVSPGLDDIPLDETSLKVYAQEIIFNKDNTYVIKDEKIYPDATMESKGSSYRFNVRLSRSDEGVAGLKIGKTYVFGVEGKDQSNNKVEADGGKPFGFRLTSNGNGPNLVINKPEDATTYIGKNTASQIFEGYVEVEMGEPTILIYKGTDEDNNLIQEIKFEEAEAIKVNGALHYDFTYPYDAFEDKNEIHKLIFKADLGGQLSQRIEKTIVYDIDAPSISITKPATAKKFSDNIGTEESGAYLNGEVEFTVMLNDKGGSGLASEDEEVESGKEPKYLAPKYEIINAADSSVISEGIITETTGQTIKINTAADEYNNKTIIFRVTAYDIAGNKSSTKDRDENYTFIINQSTDLPYIGEDETYTKLDFAMDDINAYYQQEGAKVGNVEKGAVLKFKLYDDDGAAKLFIVNKKLEITANGNTHTIANWESDATKLSNVFEVTQDTPNKLVTISSYSFPINDTDCGFYEYAIIAVDTVDNSKKTIIGPFIVRVTQDKASITVTSDKEYGNSTYEFNNTVTITPSEGPYEIYRQVVKKGTDGKWGTYTDETSSDTDISKYKKIASNILDTDLTFTDNIKIEDYYINEEAKDITVYYKVVDSIGNASVPKSVTLYIDNEPPTITIQSPISGKTGTSALTDETVQFTGIAKDEKSGVSKIFYKIDGPDLTVDSFTEMEASNGSYAIEKAFIQSSAPESEKVGKLLEGKYYFHVYAEDDAGNQSGVLTREFDVDFSNPEISASINKYIYNNTDITAGKGSFTISGTASDTLGLTSVKVYIKEVKSDGTTPKVLDVPVSGISSNNTWTKTIVFGASENTSATNYLAEGKYEIWAEATDKVGKTQSSEKKQITIDYTAPIIDYIDNNDTITTTLKLNDVVYDENKWYESKTLKVDVVVTDTVSGVSTVQCITLNKNGGERVSPLSLDENDNWTGSAQLASDGAALTITLNARDAAGNLATQVTKTVKVDTSGPTLEVYKYKIGNDGTLKTPSGTVYINNTSQLIVYGNYSDEQSGVRPLSFEGTTNGADNKPQQPTVTYSTAVASDTNDSYPISTLTDENRLSVKSWKAVFTNGMLGTDTLKVSGNNAAGAEGLSAEKNLFAISRDTVEPTFDKLNFTTDSDHFSVYAKKAKRNKTDENGNVINDDDDNPVQEEYIENYFINNKQGKFIISGLTDDSKPEDAPATEGPASGVELVKLEIEDAASHKYSKTASTAYFANIDLSEFVTSATATITVYDYAGNSKSYDLPDIVFDNDRPTGVHEIDITGKDLVFRISDRTNDDINNKTGDEKNASVFGLTWNSYTDTSVTPNKQYSKIDEAAGGKYSGGSFGNSYTQKVRGSFTDGTGSGIKQIYYKIYDRSQSLIFDTTKNEEWYYTENDLTAPDKLAALEARKNDLVEDVVSNNQYLAPLSTPEYKRVFYNVKKGDSDPYSGHQLYKNSEKVVERKKFNPTDGSWTTVKEDSPDYATAIEFYKYWKIEETTYSFTIPQLNEGCNYLVIVAEDNVGNYYIDCSDPIDHDGDGNELTSTPKRIYSNYSMNVDTTAPEIELVGSTDIQHSNGGDYTVQVKVTDPGVAGVSNSSSGIKTVKLSTDKGTVSCTYTGSNNIWEGNVKSILEDKKTYTVSATAEDVAGSSSKRVVANVMVDTTAPSVTIASPTDADKSDAGNNNKTQINGTILLSGTAEDTDGSGVKEAVALYYRIVASNAAAPAKPENKTVPGDESWNSAWKAVQCSPTGSSSWSFTGINTKKLNGTDPVTDGSRVYFTAAVKDLTDNIGYSDPIEVIIDQDTDRPVVKITSMSLLNMASNNRAGSKDAVLSGSVSDDDEIPNALAYRIGDTGTFTDSTVTGSSLTYSSDDGSFELALDDGPQNIYFKVTTNETDSNGNYISYETKLNPGNSDVEVMPKLTDRNGHSFGYKDSSIMDTVIFLAVDTEAPETEDFAFTRTPEDENAWASTISSEYFGGTQRQKFYLREYAYDANDVKQVYLSIPANENDNESQAITSWVYKNESTKVTKTIYTKGNQPTSTADYWLISTASGTKTGSLSSVAVDYKTVTISSGTNAGTYTRTAYLFHLDGPDKTTTNGKENFFLWKSADDNPVDVTNLASGERNTSLITYDGTRPTTETKIIKIDNTDPTINISAPASVTSSAVVNGSIVGESEKTTVSFAVTKEDVTDGTTITSWKEETNAGTSSFKVNFDGGDEEDVYETHATLLKQYLITLGILEQSDIDNKTALARQHHPVHVWIKSEDNCNNVGYNYQLVYVDPLGNIPTVTIGYPTSDGQTLGGSVSFMGTAKDNIDPKFVWLQFDVNNDGNWTTADYNLLKDKYAFGNMKTNANIVSGASVSDADIDDIGIKTSVEGGSWNQIVNTSHLFPNEDATSNNVTMWVYASDDDNGDGTVINVSRSEIRTFKVDKDNPYFKQDTLKLVQYATPADPTSTKQRELVYTEGMYIRGIWWLEGEVRDDSSGIKEIKKNDFGENNQYGDYSDDLSSQTTGDIRFTSELDNGNINYTFKIKVGDASESGRNRFKLKVWENKSPDTRDAEKEFIIYYDNKAPIFADPSNSSDGIATEVKNSNGFYGLHSTAYEKNNSDSGVERVAVYFTRTIENDTYIFDPMYKRGAKVDDNDISRMMTGASTSISQDTTGDKLYWGSATAATNGLDGAKVTLTTVVASYVHIGGLVKIDGFVYRIQGISENKKTVTLSSAPAALPSDNKVYFAIANVVDNSKEEKKPSNATSGVTDDYRYGYASAYDDDDFDGIMEYLKNIDTSTWDWNLYINSKNIPDGDITIHYVIFDKAGNSAYNSVNASVENNKPRLVSVKIGRDVNQDNSIAETSPETITYFPEGMDDKPTLYKNGADSITVPKIIVKSTMEVTPEIVGGNDKLYYKIKKGSETSYIGYGTNDAGIELMDGNDDYDNADWTEINEHVKNGELDTNTATIRHNLDPNNPVRYQRLISENNDAWSLYYEIYDRKEIGDPNKVYINIPLIEFAVYDEDPPSVAITPFYWKKDGDIKKSSALYEDVEIESETKTVARGHIELKSEFSSSVFTGTGEKDGDDKVSGIIKIEGTASDARKLSALYISVPGMETHFGSGTGNANLTKKTVGSGNSAVDYYQIATYNGSSWVDKAGNITNYGFAFQTSDNSVTDTGHSVKWTFTWDTSKISTITAANVNIKVLAEDAASEASASDNNPQNKTAVEPLQVDVVPYITKLVTDISESAGEEFARSATGKYIVKGSYLDTNKTAQTETVKVYGFNLALTANSVSSSATIGTLSAGGTDADDSKSSYLNLAIGTGSNSGKLSVKVNNIESLNNINQNPEKATGNNATSFKTDSVALYNSQANDETNNLLTDDVELVVWDMNYFLDETNITSPMLKMDKNGNYYMSYGYGVPSMYVNKNGTVRQIDYSYNKFQNTNVIFDDYGNTYAVATNTDRITNDSARFVFYTPNTGSMPDSVGNDVAYLYNSASKRHLEMVYNKDTGVYNIDRVKQPKLASYTDTINGKSYLAVAYYDYNDNSNPIKFRFGSKSGGSESFTQSYNSKTFTYQASIRASASDYVEGWRCNDNNTNYTGYYVEIEGNYYKLTRKNVYNQNNQYYYTLPYYAAENFSSPIYSGTLSSASNSGGIMNTLASFSRTDNPTTTTVDGYHTIANKTSTKGSGEYVSVGILPHSDGTNGYIAVVAWYDSSARKLYYSYNTDPDTVSDTVWQTKAIPIDTASYTGWYVDLAVDAGGHIHIAYYNSAKGDLKYAYLDSYNDATPEVVTVDSYLSVGTNITVNVREQSGKYIPYIYYYNSSSSRTSNSIKVAWRKDMDNLRNGAVGDKFTGAWECMTIPSANTPVDATVCGGVPTSVETEATDYSKSVVLGYMTDKYYEKAYIKGDITSANW